MEFTKTTDGIRIAYKVTGEGEPLLLVSGQGQDHHLWDLLSARLALKYRVIVFDHRGTGESDKPHTPYSTKLFAQDAIAVLDASGADKAHVLGLSMGGRVSQWLAVNYSNRVRSLILAATTPGNRHGIARTEKVSQILRSGDYAALGELIYTKEFISENLDYIIKSNDSSSTPDFAKQLHYVASENHDAWAFLPEITAPALILHGADDEINPTANADLLAQAIPGSKKVIIPGGRHGFLTEYSDTCCDIIEAFLRENALRQ